jgi:hypothetical protein
MKPVLTTLLLLCSTLSFSQKADFYKPLDQPVSLTPICIELAEKLNETLLNAKKCFDWKDRSNNCEDRANAACILLDEWGISNAKAWCFAGKSAGYKNGKGKLKGWSYHVGALVIVEHEGQIDTMVIDPLTSPTELLTIRKWADTISFNQGNLYFTTGNNRYQQNAVALKTTWKDSKDYYDATIKGLTRYNDYNNRQKRKTLDYLMERIVRVTKEFYKLYYNPPAYIGTNLCDD